MGRMLTVCLEPTIPSGMALGPVSRITWSLLLEGKSKYSVE